MRYFTKYIEVEGEIKNGDMVLKPPIFDCEELVSDCYIEEYGDNEDSSQMRLVKLFLVDSDTQEIVGQISDGAKWITEGMEFSEGQVFVKPMYARYEPHDYIGNDVIIKCPTCGQPHWMH
jgi:hypothetical protein